MTKATTLRLIAVAAALGLLIAFGAACTSSGGQTPRAQAGASTATPAPTSAATVDPTATVAAHSSAADPSPTTVSFVGKFDVNPVRATVGSSVTLSGSGFQPNETLDLVWHTVNGQWNIQGKYNEEYHGRTFTDASSTIAQVTTDTEGAFTADMTVPDDFGFNHNITVEHGGQVLNRAGFQLWPTVSISPASGPVGTPITVTMKGIGSGYLENNWMLVYDNGFDGVLTSVTTHGAAQVVIPATGDVGDHVLQIVHGAFTFPYLNGQQSPDPDRPVFTKTFTVTPGDPVTGTPPQDQGLPIEAGAAVQSNGSPLVWSDPKSGPINTAMTLHGAGFTAGQTVDFQWFRVTGNRISGSGWDESSSDLGAATVASDGSVSLSLKALDDLGGPHRIEAIVGGKTMATTSFTVTPSALPLDVSSGPAGTDILIHLKGVGWTETANIYTVTYDNHYVGYVCGFNSQGDVQLHLPLAGAPGPHYIDLYPAIYKGDEAHGVNDFRIPQLSYAQDHPGERLPAFQYVVNVTK